MVASSSSIKLGIATLATLSIGSIVQNEHKKCLYRGTFDAANIDIYLSKMNLLSMTRSIRKIGLMMPTLIFTARDTW